MSVFVFPILNTIWGLALLMNAFCRSSLPPYRGGQGGSPLFLEPHNFTLCGFNPSPGFPGVSVVKNPLPLQEPQEGWVRFLGEVDPLL